MKTWLSDIIHQANERYFTPEEMARMQEYFSTMPLRLQTASAIERADPVLGREVLAELKKQYPDRQLYSRPFANDIAALVPVLVHAMLADEVQFVRRRLVDHFQAMMTNLEMPMTEVADAIRVLREVIFRRLSAAQTSVIEPFFNALLVGIDPNGPEKLAASSSEPAHEDSPPEVATV